MVVINLFVRTKSYHLFHPYTLKSINDKRLEEAQQNILEHHVLFPIPKNELSTNPLLTPNPGYL